MVASDCRMFDRNTIDILMGDARSLLETLEAVGLVEAASLAALVVARLGEDRMAIPLTKDTEPGT